MITDKTKQFLQKLKDSGNWNDGKSDNVDSLPTYA